MESLTTTFKGPTGEHLVKYGADILQVSYDGTSGSSPVNVQRENATLIERVSFGPVTAQHVASTEAALVGQDHWRLNDRLLVKIPREDGERKSSGGILIPATAQVAKRLVWAEVMGVGQNVRTIQVGDHVLFSPEDRYEVEVRGEDYIILRERDVHAVASKRLEEGSTGLYL